MAGVRDIPPPDPPAPRPFDIDEWNEAVVPLRAQRSVEDLLAEGARHRASLARALEPMTDAQLDTRIPFGGDRKVIDLPPVLIPMEELLQAIAVHDVMHTQDILRAVPRRTQDAAIKTWVEGVDLSSLNPEILARRA